MNRDCKTCKFRSFKPDELSDNCGHRFWELLYDIEKRLDEREEDKNG